MLRVVAGVVKGANGGDIRQIRGSDKMIDIMGFSTLGAWGPLANETLKTLFEDGPSWTSKKRRITEKHNFICGISSTIMFKVANAWLKWLKGERNIAAINPERVEHVNETEKVEHFNNTEEGNDNNGESLHRIEEEKEEDDEENTNSEDEIENEREKNLQRVHWDERNSSHSYNAHNDIIDTEINLAEFDNESCGSETQSLILENSFDKDSLACEAGSIPL